MIAKFNAQVISNSKDMIVVVIALNYSMIWNVPCYGLSYGLCYVVHIQRLLGLLTFN